MPWYSSIHRGSGFKSKLATQAYEEARQIVMKFFGANPKDHVVIFGKNTTEAINKLSFRLNLKKDDIVLVGLSEHHSNDLPWRRFAKVCYVGIDSTGNIDEQHLGKLLDEHKSKVKLVAITGASNVTGVMPNIHEIAAKAHKAGAQILVDCAQLAAHRPIEIKELGDPKHLDYITISAHKMYAPFGIGALIGRKDLFEQGAPEFCGGGTISVVTRDEVQWASPPERDEAGSPNVIGAIALAKSIQELSRIGFSAIKQHEMQLSTYALRKLQTVPGIVIYGDSNPQKAEDRVGVITFNIKDLPHGLVAAILGAEFGIGVRHGCFCAHPYVVTLLGMNQSQINDFKKAAKRDDRSHMPGMVRISFGMYNTIAEVDKLIAALQKIIRGEYSGKYRLNKKTGEYLPAGWKYDAAEYFQL